MFDSKQIKKAWQIRKQAAAKFSCKIMGISWKICLKMAKEVVSMIGSEKQVAWANDIKGKAINHLDEMRAKIVATNNKYAPIAIELIDSIINNESAKWWIENRDNSYSAMWLHGEMCKISEGYANNR